MESIIPAGVSGRGASVWFERALIAAGVAILFLCVKHGLSGCDAVDRFNAVRDLISNGKVSGTPYSLIMPLSAAPLYLLSPTAEGFAWWCARFNVVVLAVGAAFLHWLLRGVVDGAVRRHCVLLLLMGSMFPAHTHNFYSDAFTAMFVAAGLLALIVRPGTAGGWVALGVAGANTPAHLPALALVALRRVWESRRWRYVLVVVAAVGVILAENWLRRGHPLLTKYESNHGVRTLLPYSGQPGFSYPLPFGVLSLLLSFGKGLLYFAPGLLLVPLVRRAQAVNPELRRYLDFSLLYVAGLVAVYAGWWAWYGGFAWGPRFLLVASVPASLAVAVALPRADTPARRVLALAILVLSVWVGANGAVFHLDNLSECNADNYAYESFMWYVPEFSVLWRPLVVMRHLRTGDYWVLGYALVVLLWLGRGVVRGLLADGDLGARRAWAALRRGPWRF
jgi:hypothetical protein